jgi:hypothetical protein
MIKSQVSDYTNQIVFESLGCDIEGHVQYMLFKTKVDDNKEVYCCWSGGNVTDNVIEFTPIGKAAFEALLNTDLSDEIQLYAEQLNTDDDLDQQVARTLAKVPHHARVCFIGDVAGKLKEQLPRAFGVLN